MPTTHAGATPGPFTVTRLTPADIGRARAMNAMFAQAFEDRAAYLGDPPGDPYLRGLLDDPHTIALVALGDGTVIGGLTAYVLRKFERTGCEVYIYDLAVAEDHRRKGVATALIAEVKRIGDSLGAVATFVQADHGDDPAIALYTGLGHREDVMHFDL